MENFVNIPVPVEHVAQVYVLLGKLAAGESIDSNAIADAGKQLPFGGWTEENLELLSKSQQTSIQRIAKMLDLLAESPGQPVSYGDIAESLHLSRGELQGALSGFTRWIRKNWGKGDDGWPMTVTIRQVQPGEQESASYYLMTPTTANRWLAVRRRS
jgi:hypothetical protein